MPAAFVALTLLADTVVVIVVRMSAAPAPLETFVGIGLGSCPIIAAKRHQFCGMPRRRNPA